MSTSRPGYWRGVACNAREPQAPPLQVSSGSSRKAFAENSTRTLLTSVQTLLFASFCESCSFRLQRLRWPKRDASLTPRNSGRRTPNAERQTPNAERSKLLAFTALFLQFVFAPLSTQAADQPDPTARLRDMLRTTILQLRAAQTENATLQAAQADSTAKIKDLNDKLEAITKQSAEDKETADKTVDDLKAQVADRDSQIAQLKDALTKWQEGYQKAADIAIAKEAERAKLATQAILLQRKVDDREAKNAELFKIGNEILTRYERFGLGTALTSREPFVGITRVKLENQVQDYQDKLLDQKIRPGQPVGTPTPAKTEQKPAPKPSPAATPVSRQPAKPTQTTVD